MNNLSTPISSARIVDAVYESLRQSIFTGEFPAGTRLSIPLLAEKLVVSRSPVREAVLRLTQEGLAAEVPRRGVVVASITRESLVRLYEIREVLEGLAARLATQRGGPLLASQLKVLMERHSAVIASGKMDEHLAIDAEFHRLLRTAADNPALCASLDALQGQFRLAMQTTKLARGPKAAFEDHEKIMAAIAAQDPDLAEAAARAHIVRLREALQRDLLSPVQGTLASPRADTQSP